MPPTVLTSRPNSCPDPVLTGPGGAKVERQGEKWGENGAAESKRGEEEEGWASGTILQSSLWPKPVSAGCPGAGPARRHFCGAGGSRLHRESPLMPPEGPPGHPGIRKARWLEQASQGAASGSQRMESGLGFSSEGTRRSHTKQRLKRNKYSSEQGGRSGRSRGLLLTQGQRDLEERRRASQLDGFRQVI